MADTTRVPHSDCPRFQAAEFGTPDSVANWLNSLPEYKLVSMLPISVTNHFSKETETSVWVIVELREPPV
jgi:hypothetical protein